MAQSAASSIERHELVCAQRWSAAISTMKEIKSILAYGGTLLIACLLGLIAFLATHPVPHA